MSMLHVVTRSCRLADCLARATASDAVILIEEGVRADLGALAQEDGPRAELHVLEEHLPKPLVVPGSPVRITDFVGFVRLTERHDTTVFWS